METVLDRNRIAQRGCDLLRLKVRDDFLRGHYDAVEIAIAGIEEVLRDAAIEHGDGGIKEAILIEDDDVAAGSIEFAAADDEEEFFEGAWSTGQDDEGIGFGEHHSQAHFHGINDAHFGK